MSSFNIQEVTAAIRDGTPIPPDQLRIMEARPKVKPYFNGAKEVIGYYYFCLGCRTEHHVPTIGWAFNGDVMRPTFTPSVLSHGDGHLLPRCHHHITDGQIQYLEDSTHSLRGKKVDMQ